MRTGTSRRGEDAAPGPRRAQSGVGAAASAAARARVVLAVVLAPALEVAPRHDGRLRVLAPHVVDVAVVGALAAPLTQVPVHAGDGLAHPRDRRHGSPPVRTVSSPRAKRVSAAPAPAITARSSAVGNSPAGAKSCERCGGTSVVGSGRCARMDLNQMRAASRITTMIMVANSAARMPSTVELVTTVCIWSTFLAGGSTLFCAIASLNASRWAKKPSFGLSENTFW